MTVLTTDDRIPNGYAAHLRATYPDVTYRPLRRFTWAFLPWLRIVRRARFILTSHPRTALVLVPIAWMFRMRLLYIDEAMDGSAVRGARRWLVKRRCTILTPSTVARDQFLVAGAAPETVVCIAAGIDPASQQIQRTLFSTIAERRHPRKGGFAICTIAALEEESGIEYLLQACAMAQVTVSNLHVTIVGDGSAKQALKWTAQKLGIADHVLFTGRDARADRWIEGVDLVVFPHCAAPQWSDAPLRAMAYGKPIVATNVGVFPEIIERRITGMLIEPKNATMLAEAITNFAHHPDWRSEMGKRGLERVMQVYSYTAARDRLAQLFGA